MNNQKRKKGPPLRDSRLPKKVDDEDDHSGAILPGDTSVLLSSSNESVPNPPPAPPSVNMSLPLSDKMDKDDDIELYVSVVLFLVLCILVFDPLNFFFSSSFLVSLLCLSVHLLACSLLFSYSHLSPRHCFTTSGSWSFYGRRAEAVR